MSDDTSSSERLGWAIFIAAAAHGVAILGLGFVPPQWFGPDEVPTLEVTLLTSPVPDQPVPEDAQYLAQASQEGVGNVEEHVRPEFFDSPPAPQSPEAMARGLELELSMAAGAPPSNEHLASWASTLQSAATQPAESAEARPAELPPEGGVTRVTTAGERELFVSVNARESVFAEYLAAWKARMERLGTLNYPAIGPRPGGHPVLEVAIGADGGLREVRVTHSSGNSALDQAAVDLVRLASPYDAFPPMVRAQFDVLRFAYEWRFIDGQAGGGRLTAPER
jgi:periplasmic protein TonB